MRRGRTLIFVLLLVIILGVVGFLAYNQLKPKPPVAALPTTTVEVYIAKQPIPQGVAVTEDVLGTMKIPPENVISVMFEVGEKPLLLGKIAKYAIDQGTPITESMVLDSASAVPITGPKWATSIPPGMTAISIPTSSLATSAFAINEGAHVNINGCFQFVDIDPAFQTLLPNDTAPLSSTGFLPDTLTALTLGVGTVSGPQGRVELDPSLQQPYYLVPNALDKMQRPRMVCQMLLQDIVVMKLGEFSLTDTGSASSAPSAAPAPTQAPNPQQQQPQNTDKPSIITLIVTPQDSITLTYLMYADAQITMTLRNPGDQARQATEAATLQFLLSQYNIPVPAKLPYSMDITFTANEPGLQITNPPEVSAP